MPTPQVDEFLMSAHRAIENALASPEIQDALARYGYTRDRLEQGKIFYEIADTAQQEQQQEYGDQLAEGSPLNQSWQDARSIYNQQAEIARIALKDSPELLAELGLEGKRKRSLTAWLSQAYQFYTNSLNNPTVLAALAQFNITHEELAAGEAKVESLAKLNAEIEAEFSRQYELEIGKAPPNSQTRESAFEALDDWLEDFQTVARVALNGNPQLLASLGL